MGLRMERSINNKIFLPACIIACLAFIAWGGFSPNAPTAMQTQALARASFFLAHDELREADSVFTEFGLEGTMGAGDLMQWVRIKGTLAQYGQAGRLACRAMEKAPQYGAMARFQLSEILKDAKIDTVRSVVAAYGACAAQSRAPDTADLRDWMARTYEAFGLFSEEIDALIVLDTRSSPSARGLLECGKRAMARGLFTYAIPAARVAYDRLAGPSDKALCALVLYQSYAKLGKTDSAAWWLVKAPMAKEAFRAEAAAFFQRAGHAARADSLIETLPKSFMRDTLSIRQSLFAHDVKAAVDRAFRVFVGAATGAERSAAMLWRMRTLVFAGNLGAARELLDSIDFSPSMREADEILADKYAVFALQSDPSAWGEFAEAVFAAWAGFSDMACASLMSPRLDGISPRGKQLILSYCLKTLIADKVYLQARKAVEGLSREELSAENRYYYGDVLVHSGEIEQGRRVFEELVLKFPADVFSGKARMALIALGN
jgi:tetratricopeptide (TPR) repeat protein